VKEPLWITEREARVLHERLIALFGGRGGGPRDRNLLQAALARPINEWHYEDRRPDSYALAAAYGFAIARGHVFPDGNKRTAHAVAAVFLENNGVSHLPPEGDVVSVMVAVADGAMAEDELAE
jgi:death-on-curing protein